MARVGHDLRPSKSSSTTSKSRRHGSDTVSSGSLLQQPRASSQPRGLLSKACVPRPLRQMAAILPNKSTGLDNKTKPNSRVERSLLPKKRKPKHSEYPISPQAGKQSYIRHEEISRSYLDTASESESSNDDQSEYSFRDDSSFTTINSTDSFVLRPLERPGRVCSEQEHEKTFEANKVDLAIGFLEELDREITQGRIAELTRSVGGVQIVWSRTLNKTAGRAKWKREAIPENTCGDKIPTLWKHHAKIELAEKVIDEESRLFNTLAHEFCHLANFMITGTRNKPHGKDFKAWATKVNCRFADRGINVTTKHRYHINYSHVWACIFCHMQYKRHSNSINPIRSRCGRCQDFLIQTIPVPRRLTAYRIFVNEQVSILEQNNPGR